MKKRFMKNMKRFGCSFGLALIIIIIALLELLQISDEGFYNSTSRQSTVIDDPSTSSEEEKKVCRVIYDFTPQNEEEIEVNDISYMRTLDNISFCGEYINVLPKDQFQIRAGESVLIESRLGPDWCFGRVISPVGRPLPPRTIGRFPTTYVCIQEASIFLQITQIPYQIQSPLLTQCPSSFDLPCVDLPTNYAFPWSETVQFHEFQIVFRLVITSTNASIIVS